MSKLPAWFRMSVTWYTDDVLLAAADASGFRLTTFALWPVLIAMAKDASSPANTAGEFTTTPRRLAKAIGTNEREIGAVLARLSEGDLLTVKRGKLGVIRVRLARFEEWQTAKGTNAEFVARAKFNKQALSGDGKGLGQGSDRVGTTETGDRREEKKVSSDTLSGSGKPNSDRAATIRSIYQHWCEQSGKPTRKLTADRRSRINARLADGYTPDEIKQAITNGLRDPFLQGDNGRGKVYDDLSTIIGSAEKLERYRDADTRTPTSTSSWADL